jgi:hypothetical protein
MAGCFALGLLLGLRWALRGGGYNFRVIALVACKVYGLVYADYLGDRDSFI